MWLEKGEQKEYNLPELIAVDIFVLMYSIISTRSLVRLQVFSDEATKELLWIITLLYYAKHFTISIWVSMANIVKMSCNTFRIPRIYCNYPRFINE